MAGRKYEQNTGPWGAEEDQILRDHVEKNGACGWNELYSRGILSRSGISCSVRWHDHLRHGGERKHGNFSAEEARKVKELQAKLGNKWSKIANNLPGRTRIDVMTFWNTNCQKMERQENKHITVSEPQTLNESFPLEVQSSSSSQLVEQSSVHMLGPSEPLVEEGVTDTSLQLPSTSMPYQQEIEVESSLYYNGTNPDDFHDLPDNLTISDPQTLNESLPLEVQSSSFSQLVEQSSIHMLDPSELLVEEGITDTSLQLPSTSMPYQQEIEVESSLSYNATNPDDFHDLPDNLTISDPQTLNESLPLEVQSSSSSQLVPQSSIYMQEEAFETFFEEGVMDTSLQLPSTLMPYQQEIEIENSLSYDVTNLDDFHDLPDYLTISDPQTFNESLPLEVQSSSSSQLVEQSSVHMLDPSEPLVEEGVTDTSLQLPSTSMPYQQEIEVESSLYYNGTNPDDFHDLPDNLTISDPQTLNESLPLEVQSSSSSQLVPQSYVYMQEEASETLIEADVSSTLLQVKRLNQQEIEAEISLPCNATPDEFHDLPDKIDVDDK